MAAHASNGKVHSRARRQRPAAAAAAAAPSATGPNGRAKVGPAAPAQPPGAGRTAKGTFAANNKIGRGNPHARLLAAHRAALLSAVTAEDLAALGGKLLAAALAGDWLAAKLLLSYVVGKPREVVDPDRLDLDEFRQVIAGPSLASVLYASTQTVDPRLAVEAWADLRPADADALWRRLDDECGRAPETFDRFFQNEGKARAGR
jgi:hypothetical protein